MQEIIALILLSISGILVKLTDAQIEHGLKLFRYGKYFTALMFGTILGYLISTDAKIASLILGVTTANIAMKKFDDNAFWVAMVPLVGIVLLLGFQGIIWLAFGVFLVSAAFDEIMNDRKHQNVVISFLSDNRLFTWIAAFLLGIYLMEFIYFIGIICFDIGYTGTSKLLEQNTL